MWCLNEGIRVRYSDWVGVQGLPDGKELLGEERRARLDVAELLDRQPGLVLEAAQEMLGVRGGHG